MKMRTLFAAFITIMLFALLSCKTSPKDAISRKWKATSIDGTNIPAEAKQEFSRTSNTIEFTKDGKYTSVASGMSESGNYQITEDGKTLTMMSSGGGTTQSMNVKELSKETLVLTRDNLSITFKEAK